MKDKRLIPTVCPYCGVGCGFYLVVHEGGATGLEYRTDHPVNNGRLCAKGNAALEVLHHPDRLAYPMKKIRGRWERITWSEALNTVAAKLQASCDSNSPDSNAFLASAKCTNEENYLFQKLARLLGTNNVDHCARLCHAPTIVALAAAFGSGAMTNPLADLARADCIFVIGSNLAANHAPALHWIWAAKDRGAQVIVADPRHTATAWLANEFLQLKPGSDVALLNGMAHVIIAEGLADLNFIEGRTTGFGALAACVKEYTPQKVTALTGLAASQIVRAARTFARAEAATIAYCMGITQHTTGTDNVKAIANLLMLTGNIGRKATGFSPLRGQNNVQGACDMGALPNVYPGYQKVDDPEAMTKFSRAWHTDLDTRVGLALTEMFKAAHNKQLKAMLIVGENPLLSEPNLPFVREAIHNLNFLAVQDIFLTETARMADVVLPAASFAEKEGTFTNTERRIQLLRQALEPPGEARGDWQIIAALAARMGFPMHYASAAAIMDEIARLTPIYGGISHGRLNRRGGLQWPCWDHGHPGTSRLHVGQFTRGRGKFHVVHDRPPAEQPSREYPIVLTTGRVLEHWHTGSMSHRSAVLETLAPGSNVDLNPGDAARLGLMEGDGVEVLSRRGKIQGKVHADRRVPRGTVFMAFHWRDAPANELTNDAVDPQSKIPEFKVASVSVRPLRTRAAGP
ncbi:MAG: formate dehydrogenase subunit alpha [Desulfobacterales bacterium]|nr:MAG: formate dehydrogenase subunit alpha [Desulfobacterales bacterium]